MLTSLPWYKLISNTTYQDVVSRIRASFLQYSCDIKSRKKISKTQVKGYFIRLKAHNSQKCQSHDSQEKTEELVPIQGHCGTETKLNK